MAAKSSSAGPQAGAAPEFLAWASDHQRERRRHGADLAQITEHPDPHAREDAMAQQQAWVRRRNHSRHLHDSALAQIRPQVDPAGSLP
ncbi:MAG: hypothetical protein ACK5E6_14325 [Cyanobacteriota bacterium]|jgi:hypothetical protein